MDNNKSTGEPNWKCTDSDSQQYSLNLGNRIFKFKEFDRDNYEINLEDYPTTELFIDAVWDNPEFWVSDSIDLNKASSDEVKSAISGYYKSLGELHQIYGDDSDAIIAECIFECGCGLY